MDKGKNTVESLEFMVAQFFVAFMGIALPQEFTSSTKTNFEGVSLVFFFTEAENRNSYEITSPQISKQPKIHKN